MNNQSDAVELERVKNKIWERVRLAEGDGLTITRGVGYEPDEADGNKICLVGAILHRVEPAPVGLGALTRETSKILGIEHADALQLEFGFEGWANPPARVDSDYYKLGQAFHEELQQKRARP